MSDVTVPTTIEDNPGVTGITINEHPTLSIIVPTYNHLAPLRRCIQNIRANVSVSHELIIVEGRSIDGTREFLARHNGLRVIHEAKRQGATQARNKGFRAARGQYVMWLDDSAYPLRGSVEAAIAELQRSDGVGMVGFYDDCDCARPVRDSIQHDGQTYRLYDVKGYIYADFGLLPRTVLVGLGYADDRRVDMTPDAHPSLRVQLETGLRVVGCRDALVHRQRRAESRRLDFHAPLSRDAQKAVTIWNNVQTDETPQPALRQHASDELQLA